MKCCEYGTRDCIRKTLFSSQLNNEPNELEFYITLGQKGLSVKNPLDYNIHSQVTEKMKCCDQGLHSQNFIFFTT